MPTENARYYFGILAEISSIAFGLVFIVDFHGLQISVKILLVTIGLLALLSGCVIFGYLVSQDAARPLGLTLLVFATWLGLLITFIFQMAAADNFLGKETIAPGCESALIELGHYINLARH